MPKPITQWGADEVRAMFAGLPEGAAIVRKGNSLLVANVRQVEVESAHEWGMSDQKMVCYLKWDAAFHNHMVEHTLPDKVQVACADMDEAMRLFKKAQEELKGA